MATNVIQGTNAVLSFYNGSYVPYVCATDISLEITTDTQEIKTIGDGIWGKQRGVINRYQLTLSGVIKFTNSNFTAWDIIQNQIGWVDMQYLLSYTDDGGNIKSFQGYLTVLRSSIGASVGQVVKGDHTFQGNGLLKFFDGLVPCATSVDSVTVTNPTDSAGNIVFDYTFTGAVYQVKYRLDNMGAWSYALVAGATFTIDSVPIGDHSIEVIPICTNSYEGTGFTQTFTATHLLTCALDISSITNSVSGNNVTWTVNYTSDPSGSTLKYRIDGGAWVYPLITVTNPTIFVTPLAVGSHTIEVVPICSNGVAGTGNTDTATVSSGSTISLINWAFTAIPGGGPLFYVYLNGVIVVNKNATASGSFTANNGDTIKALVQVAFAGRDMTLQVHDDSLGSYLYNHNQITPSSITTDTYIFTANGDTFTITGTISP
jgi:hypothetical protein